MSTGNKNINGMYFFNIQIIELQLIGYPHKMAIINFSYRYLFIVILLTYLFKVQKSKSPFC